MISIVKDPSPHTIGVEFNSTLLKLPSSSSSTSRTLRLHLWDTAGQERFRAVTRNYYRDTAGIILVYDITRRASFENLSTWLADARALSSSSTKVIVVGNKSDLVQEREVSEIEANRWAKENSFVFVSSFFV
jgi:Ras-related protein Rab-4B